MLYCRWRPASRHRVLAPHNIVLVAALSLGCSEVKASVAIIRYCKVGWSSPSVYVDLSTLHGSGTCPRATKNKKMTRSIIIIRYSRLIERVMFWHAQHSVACRWCY